MSDPENPDVPDPLAQLDQAIAGLATRAKVIHAYFLALQSAGFNEVQAFQLTMAYQSQWAV